MLTLINGCVELITENDMVVHSSNGTGLFEPETFDVLDSLLHSGDLFLDIGAYTGIYSIYAAKKHDCTVYAFEPNPKVYDRLKRNIGVNETKNNVYTFPYALSNEKKTTELWVNPRTMLTSGGSIESVNANYSCVQIQCEIYDELPISVPTVDGMKIDVEGHELSVLEGLSYTIERDKPFIIVECLTLLQSDSVTTFLRSMGYKRKAILDERNFLFIFE